MEAVETLPTQVCKVCRIEKSIDKYRQNGPYLRSTCTECKNKQDLDKYYAKKATQPPKIKVIKEKVVKTHQVCIKCNQDLSIEHFSKNGDYHKTTCKSCTNLYSKNHHQIVKVERNAQIRDKYWEKRIAAGPTLRDIQLEKGVKNCIICKEEKKYEEFYTEKDGRFSSRCKICAILKFNEWKKTLSKDDINRMKRNYVVKYPRKFLLMMAKRRSRNKNLEFNLTIDDIIIPSICPILNIPITLGQNRDSSPSIDRINNSKGYVKDNIIITSFRANTLKRDSSPEERQKLVDFYTNIEDNKKKIQLMDFVISEPIKNIWHNILDVEERNKIRREAYKNNSIGDMYSRAKSRTKKSGLEFTIKITDIKVPIRCPIFDIPLVTASDNIENSPSLERIDSTRGYTPDNIIVISYRANRCKGNATLEEMIKINEFYKKLL